MKPILDKVFMSPTIENILEANEEIDKETKSLKKAIICLGNMRLAIQIACGHKNGERSMVNNSKCDICHKWIEGEGSG